MIRPLLIKVLRLALKGHKTRLILQNKDDREMFLGYKIIENERIILIRGSGVDTDKFFPRKLRKNLTTVILPARMLWDKGVHEFVSCAQQLKEDGVTARFCLVGGVDTQNPESVSVAQLKKWTDQKVVEWRGIRIICLKFIHDQLLFAFLPTAKGFRNPYLKLQVLVCLLWLITSLDAVRL